MTVQYEIRITGRVQGVGFRFFAREKAAVCNITGWVKNMPDGNLFILAQGTETDINTFLDYLKIGPSMSRVNKIIKNKIPGIDKFSSFQVKY